MNPADNTQDQQHSTDTAQFNSEQKLAPDYAKTDEAIQQDIVRDDEDSRNSRIAVILLWVGIICAILLIILSVRLLSGYLYEMHKEIDYSSERDNDYDYEPDIDIGEFDTDIDVDQILSQFDEEEFENALSRDIEALKSQKSKEETSSDEGTALLDFCNNEELDKFAADIENRHVMLFIQKDGTWHDTVDKDDILKVFDAMKTVRIGERTTDYGDSEWLEIDFFDGQTETSWNFDFLDGCLEWKDGEHYYMYKVLDWGDLEGLRIDSIGITLDDL